MLVLMLFSRESITVNTEIMANIPIVIPSKDKKVRNLLTIKELIAYKKLSFIKKMRSISYLLIFTAKLDFFLSIVNSLTRKVFLK